MAPPLFSGDTENHRVSFIESSSFVCYADSAQYTTSTETDLLYTAAFWLGDVDLASIQLVQWMSQVTGTEDVDTYIQLSNHPGTIYNGQSYVPDSSFSTGVKLIDLQSVAVKKDTFNIATQTGYDRALWGRLYHSGQTGNPVNSIVWWSLFCRKVSGAPEKSAGSKPTATTWR